MDVLFRFASEALSVVDVLTEHPRADAFQFHAHHTYEMYLFVSGKGCYCVEQTRYPLESGSIILLRPGESHAVMIDEASAYERIVIRFSPQALQGVDGKLSLLDAFHFRCAGQFNCYTPAQTAIEFVPLLKKSFSQQHDPAQYYFQILGLLIWMLSAVNHVFSRPKESGRSALAKDEIPDIISQINRNICGELDIDAICREHYISRVYLNRCFREATNCSVWEYITIRRLTLARQRIESGQTAMNAAIECGFKDYSVFFRSFKRHFGYPPSACLKRPVKEHTGPAAPEGFMPPRIPAHPCRV